MLQICRSNLVELLLASLAERLADAPLSSPFARELVVTPSPAMARWVNLRLARVHGVAANYEYPLPASFVWQLARELLGDLPDADPLERERMAWQVYSLLPGMLDEAAFEPLRRYLREDRDGLKRWQLANRIADVFDRYQLYRPALLGDWDAGQGGDWQAALWRRLTGDLEQHRVAVIERLLQRLSSGSESGRLPERVSLFAVSSLPPLLVEVIHALALHTSVDCYLHSPTREFWADLVSQKELARKRLQRPEEAELWEVGNSLLGSWGRQGQALQDLLLARETPLFELDVFREPVGRNLLERVQQDIYTLRSAPPGDARAACDPDGSVQVHVCHSGLRECQVLHDALLDMLERDPALRPEEILVMVPEISRYAPCVEAVFDRDGAGSRPFIPWNLSDISLRDEHPLVRVFLQLLDLPNSRFSHSEVVSYLEIGELAGHFGLDGEAVAQIRDWLAQARLRWGLDGRHKQRLGLPALEENTWAQAEQRLFGGYALGAGARFQGIAPIPSVEGTKGEALGRFWRLLSRLVDTAERLSPPRRIEAWQATIGQMLGDFFGETEDREGRLQKIRDALAELAAQAGELDEAVPLPLVRQWLEQRLGSEGRRGRYFSGGVTFCGMRPMRSLPFKVICVLGMQDQAFPRRDQLAEFDLMRTRWRPGDPRKADEDRYLFLETLLCARQCLYLSYVGRDIRNNTERQPSVLVRELLDYLDQHYRPAEAGDAGRLSERLTTVHPMQPFSADNYTGARRSFDDAWCEVAGIVVRAATGNDEPSPAHWSEASLMPPAETLREVPLVQLERFLRHPVRYFINTRLKVYLREAVIEDDDEVFTLAGLPRFDLRQRLVDAQLQGRAPPLRELVAEGLLPHGSFAALSLEAEADRVEPLVERLAPYRGQRPEQIAVDLAFDAGAAGPRRLVGQLRGVYPGLGLLRYRASALKGAEILALWLAHLAWCATGAAGEKRSSLHAQDASFIIAATLEPTAARGALARYLGYYWQGVHRPLLLLPAASYAYARTLNQAGQAGRAKAAAWKAWLGDAYKRFPGDKDDPYVRLVMRGVPGEPLEHPDFPRLAGDFYGQVLDLEQRR